MLAAKRWRSDETQLFMCPDEFSQSIVPLAASLAFVNPACFLLVSLGR